MNTIRGLRDALDLIGEKHEDKPDFGARDFVLDDEDAELYGDHVTLAQLDDEL